MLADLVFTTTLTSVIMGKKRKKNSTARAKKAAPSTFSGSLADQLQGVQVTNKPTPKTPQKTKAHAPPRPEELPSMSDEDIFARAMSEMTHVPKRHKKKSEFSSGMAQKLSKARVFEHINVAPAKPEAPEPKQEPRAHIPAAPELSLDPTATPLTDEELFESAVDKMTNADVFMGKYQGDVRGLPKQTLLEPTLPDPEAGDDAEEPTLSEEEQRAQLEELREDMLFSHFVGQVDHVAGKNKYYRTKPRASTTKPPEPTYSSETPDGLITPTLPKSGEGLNYVEALHSSQKGLLNRSKLWARRNTLQVLNLRGDSIEDALRQLELFVHQAWKDGDKYVRVITGRGLKSTDKHPAIKATTLQWLEGPGFRYVRGYAPELTSERDYGSLIVALAKKEGKHERGPKQ